MVRKGLRKGSGIGDESWKMRSSSREEERNECHEQILKSMKICGGSGKPSNGLWKAASKS